MCAFCHQLGVSANAGGERLGKSASFFPISSTAMFGNKLPWEAVIEFLGFATLQKVEHPG
jgi:hypothetical protein